MIDNATGLPYLQNHLDAHGITSIINECSDGCYEMVFTCTPLKGLMLVFNEDDDLIAAEYIGEPIDA